MKTAGYIANLVCDVGWNEVLIGHQVHHNRVPHVPADTDRLAVNIHLYIFLVVTNILFNNQKVVLYGNSQSILNLICFVCFIFVFICSHYATLEQTHTQKKNNIRH